MGFHYTKLELLDADLDALNPEVVLIGPDGTGLVAVEYLVPWQKDQPVPTIFGQEFEGPMAGHGPGIPVHYDLHVWLVDNPAGEFGDFNPGLSLCAEGSLPPPPSAEMVAGIYGGISADAAVVLGYEADPFCIDARLAGMPDLGSMGFHYGAHDLLEAPLNPLAPAVVLVHPTESRVVAVEYIASGEASLFGQDFDPPQPDGPPFFSLHLWAEPNPAGMFAPFNPSLPLCPAGSLPPELPATGDASLTKAVSVAGLVGMLTLGTGIGLLVRAGHRRKMWAA